MPTDFDAVTQSLTTRAVSAKGDERRGVVVWSDRAGRWRREPSAAHRAAGYGAGLGWLSVAGGHLDAAAVVAPRFRRTSAQ